MHYSRSCSNNYANCLLCELLPYCIHYSLLCCLYMICVAILFVLHCEIAQITLSSILTVKLYIVYSYSKFHFCITISIRCCLMYWLSYFSANFIISFCALLDCVPVIFTQTVFLSFSYSTGCSLICGRVVLKCQNWH